MSKVCFSNHHVRQALLGLWRGVAHAAVEESLASLAVGITGNRARCRSLGIVGCIGLLCARARTCCDHDCQQGACDPLCFGGGVHSTRIA